MNKHTLILGLGNDILMDDGIGIRLCREMQHYFTDEAISFETASLGGLEILELIQGYNNVIFIDAIKTKDGIPGTVYYFQPSDFKETSNLSNLHDVSFLTALEIGKKLNMKIPESMHIIAVEIIEDLTFGEDFTPEIQDKFPEIIVQVRDIIDKILKQPINLAGLCHL
ncbi:MAG TPA: hydrogenase maturation protease [Bacteroidales bacterium]|nr:hydrogenase maturation protease [Bacteroidales bacterium]